MNVNISIRFIRIWQRNLTVYRENWKINFLPPLLEPLFYLVAFGIGFSGLIGNITYASRETSYVRFIAPALVAINILFLKTLSVRLCECIIKKHLTL